MPNGGSKVVVALIALLLLVPSFASAEFIRPLSLGSTGPDVVDLQTILKDKGFFLYPEITGYYGQITLQAVADFQRSVDLDPLGYVGPLTRGILNGLLNSSTPAPSTSTATDLITKLQTLLADLGFYKPDVPSGIYDAETIEALDDFDRDAKDGKIGNNRSRGGNGGNNDTPAPTPGDTTPPVLSNSAPSGTLALNTTSTILSLDTDEAASCAYSTSSGTAFGSMTIFDTTGVTSHSSSLSGLSNGSSYTYYVKCQDGSANTNPSDYTISFSVAADASAPTVSMTAPANAATVSGTNVALTATASDDVSVSGVQFKLDTNTNIGAEDTTSSYGVSWDSTGVADGSHTLLAVARDGAGNRATSTAVNVTVDNSGPVISSVASSTEETTATITWTTNESSNSKVVYGLTSSYGSASTSASMTTSHSIGLTSLTEETIYHFAVVSTDAQGNAATSSDQTFTTATASLAFPATGASFDFDWVNDSYYTTTANVQRTTDNTSPMLYRQQLTQATHFIENEDGTLVSRTTVPRRSTKGLHSWNRVNQYVSAPRDLTNASWTKSGVTALKNQTGRDGSANGASSISFASDGDTVSITTTHASNPVRLLFDIKRISGSAPIEASINGGSTWESINPGDANWHRFLGSFLTQANTTVTLRGSAGNSFAIDFVNLMYPELGGQGLGGRLASATAIGKDRINSSLANSGTNDLNDLRSTSQHGMYMEWSSGIYGNLLTPVNGFSLDLTTNSLRVVRQGGTSILTHSGTVALDDGSGTTRHKMMYYFNNGVMRLALDGVLESQGSFETPASSSTHDLGTNGSGTALDGFIRRTTYFGSTVPTDAQMIEWTSW